MRVLVMNDARLLAELEGTLLGRASLEVHVAPPGADLARLATDIEPHAIVLGDAESCPDPVGTCRRLRANGTTSRAAVIFVGVAFLAERARDAGASEFLARPVTRGDLKRALTRALPIEDRAALRSPIGSGCEFIHRGARLPATCVNISLSGALIALRAEYAPEVGAHGSLALTMRGRPLELSCEVVRARACDALYEVGVRFIDVDDATRVFLGRATREASRGAEMAGETP